MMCRATASRPSLPCPALPGPGRVGRVRLTTAVTAIATAVVCHKDTARRRSIFGLAQQPGWWWWSLCMLGRRERARDAWVNPLSCIVYSTLCFDFNGYLWINPPSALLVFFAVYSDDAGRCGERRLNVADSQASSLISPLTPPSTCLLPTLHSTQADRELDGKPIGECLPLHARARSPTHAQTGRKHNATGWAAET